MVIKKIVFILILKSQGDEGDLILLIFMGQRSLKMTCSVIKVHLIRKGALVERKFKHIPPLDTSTKLYGHHNHHVNKTSVILHFLPKSLEKY